MESLERVTLKKGDMPSYSQETCSICLTDFKVKDKLLVLVCEHAFHERCIERWLRQAKECPNCKRDTTIIEEDEYAISS